MVKHYNPSIGEDLQRIFNVKQGDQFSADVLPNITPVMIVQRACSVARSATAINTTATTIFTVPTDRDFYLVSASLVSIQDATATSTTSAVRIVVDGVNRNILSKPSFTLSVQLVPSSVAIYFGNIGIKCDRGSTISVTNTTATANVSSHGTIIGYLVDTLDTTPS